MLFVAVKKCIGSSITLSGIINTKKAMIIPNPMDQPTHLHLLPHPQSPLSSSWISSVVSSSSLIVSVGECSSSFSQLS